MAESQKQKSNCYTDVKNKFRAERGERKTRVPDEEPKRATGDRKAEVRPDLKGRLELSSAETEKTRKKRVYTENSRCSGYSDPTELGLWEFGITLYLCFEN